MREDPAILYFGEGIGERGGSFAHTKGLWKEFGGEREDEDHGVDARLCEPRMRHDSQRGAAKLRHDQPVTLLTIFFKYDWQEIGSGRPWRQKCFNW